MREAWTKANKFNRIVRHCTPLFLSFLALWLLREHLPAIDIQVILATFNAFALHQWLLAVAFTALSLAAVGFYDVHAARLMNVPVTSRAAFAAGWRATAIAQTLGFGLVTGSLVRWRLLKLQGKTGLWTATKMTSVVTASYFFGWLVVAGLAATSFPGLPDQIWWLGILALWLGFALAILSLRASPHAVRGFPPIRVLGRVSVLTLVDTLAASAVIYCFLPDGYTPFLLFYISFLLAYSIGMISGVPGGVGPFEMCLLALIAPTDATPLLAALIAYRAAYFLLPAVLAAVSLVTPLKNSRNVALSSPPSSTKVDWPAEVALIGQGPLNQVQVDATGGIACQTLNSEIHLRDPAGPTITSFLTHRKKGARYTGKRLFLYKCSAQVAVQARKAGLNVAPIASEALLCPNTFAPEGKAYAQLRRKLRKAQKAGVAYSTGAPRLSDMQSIDRKWQARCGRARGFSVGQFTPALVRKQAVFTAFHEGDPIAFITVHVSKNRWVLDLMRSSANCPDGTMQGLVLQAVSAAKDAGVDRFSLCSAPYFVPNLRSTWISRTLAAAFARSSSAKGLWRFKSGFNPRWQREYIAFDGPLALILGGYDIAQLISNPRTVADINTPPTIHDHYDNYEFASLQEK